MDTQIFQRFVNLTKNLQKPLQDLTELNVKTLQSMSYIRPDEFAKIKAPEELVEKQIHITLENGHKALDYMRKSFDIVESTLLSFAKVPSSETVSKGFAEVFAETDLPVVKTKKPLKVRKVSKSKAVKAAAAQATVVKKTKAKKVSKKKVS